MKQQPSFYSILPAYVRYSKDLTDFEKILYTEIMALTNILGYCYASNSYFATWYGKTTVTISKSINKLVTLGFLTSVIDQENGNQRRLYPSDSSIKVNHTEKQLESIAIRNYEIVNVQRENDPIKENLNTPIKENFNHSTTSYINDLKEIKKLFDSIYKKPLK